MQLKRILTSVGRRRLVDVDEDARIGGAVYSRNLDSRRGGGSRATDVDLEAGHVELRTADAACNMKGCRGSEVSALAMSSSLCIPMTSARRR